MINAIYPWWRSHIYSETTQYEERNSKKKRPIMQREEKNKDRIHNTTTTTTLPPAGGHTLGWGALHPIDDHLGLRTLTVKHRQVLTDEIVLFRLQADTGEACWCRCARTDKEYAT